MDEGQPDIDQSSSDAPQSASQRQGLNEFRSLVRAAFEQARTSGKERWREMTSAVLKNRILGLTDRQFSQERYGSPSFIHLVRRVPELIELVDESPPFLLRYRDDDTDGPISDIEKLLVDVPYIESAQKERDWRRTRVRDDLWRATLDYSSVSGYVLDASSGLARERQPTDTEVLAFSTLNQAGLDRWRQMFMEQLAPSVDSSRRARVQTWIDRGGRQADLPPFARGQWAEFMKKAVYQHLMEFYSSHELPLPDDALVDAATIGLPRLEAIDDVVHVRRLRDLIIQAVRVMAPDELAKVPLPAEVVLRIMGRVPGRNE